jgi:hypothetical protein
MTKSETKMIVVSYIHTDLHDILHHNNPCITYVYMYTISASACDGTPSNGLGTCIPIDSTNFTCDCDVGYNGEVIIS